MSVLKNILGTITMLVALFSVSLSTLANIGEINVDAQEVAVENEPYATFPTSVCYNFLDEIELNQFGGGFENTDYVDSHIITIAGVSYDTVAISEAGFAVWDLYSSDYVYIPGEVDIDNGFITVGSEVATDIVAGTSYSSTIEVPIESCSDEENLATCIEIGMCDTPTGQAQCNTFPIAYDYEFFTEGDTLSIPAISGAMDYSSTPTIDTNGDGMITIGDQYGWDNFPIDGWTGNEMGGGYPGQDFPFRDVTEVGFISDGSTHSPTFEGSGWFLSGGEVILTLGANMYDITSYIVNKDGSVLCSNTDTAIITLTKEDKPTGQAQCPSPVAYDFTYYTDGDSMMNPVIKGMVNESNYQDKNGDGVISFGDVYGWDNFPVDGWTGDEMGGGYPGSGQFPFDSYIEIAIQSGDQWAQVLAGNTQVANEWFAAEGVAELLVGDNNYEARYVTIDKDGDVLCQNIDAGVLTIVNNEEAPYCAKIETPDFTYFSANGAHSVAGMTGSLDFNAAYYGGDHTISSDVSIIIIGKDSSSEMTIERADNGNWILTDQGEHPNNTPFDPYMYAEGEYAYTVTFRLDNEFGEVICSDSSTGNLVIKKSGVSTSVAAKTTTNTKMLAETGISTTQSVVISSSLVLLASIVFFYKKKLQKIV